MNIHLSLNSIGARAAAVSAVLFLCGGLVSVVLCHFLVNALSDSRIPITVEATRASFITAPFTEKRIGVNPAVLTAAADFLPNSARLQLRLAAFESLQFSEDWGSDEKRARRAVGLSPHDYRPLLLLASIQESRADLPGAEKSARAVLALAPNSIDAHWQLATLLLRRREFTESLEEFRKAAAGNVAYLSAALEMVWLESGERVDALITVTPRDTGAMLELARFLLEKSRPADSAKVFLQIDHKALPDARRSGLYLNTLIARGHFRLAHELWSAVAAGDASSRSSNLMSNPGFETDILLELSQFDWSIKPSAYAQISIDRDSIGHNSAHGGRSLRLDFLGKETTRLTEEIKQLVVVRTGARYRLRYDIRTESLVASEGPRVVLSVPSSQKLVASSDAVPLGSNDWQQRTIEFEAPDAALIVAVEQRPKFSYEDPTTGTVWFDNFEIEEIHER